MNEVTRNSRFKITILNKNHDKNSFSCNHVELDNYLHKQASQDIKRSISVTYVLTSENDHIVLGYYSLASTSINIGELPEAFSKKLPRYPILPAILLGRLAVDQKHEGKGFGARLLIDALKRSLDSSKEIGSIAIVVNAKDDNAAKFYTHYSFIKLNDEELKLFLAMTEVKKLFLA
jgi:predicted GNAT family N-acyltransferase